MVRSGRLHRALTIALAACAFAAGCASQNPPAAADPIDLPQICWGPNAIAKNLGEPAAAVYAPYRRRSIMPASIGDRELRRLMRGSVMVMLRRDWRQILESGGDGAEQVVADSRAAAAELIAEPSLIRRPATLRQTFAEAEAVATRFGFSTCTSGR